MDKLKRRDFLKMAGLAVACPTQLLTGKAEGRIVSAGLEFPKLHKGDWHHFSTNIEYHFSTNPAYNCIEILCITGFFCQIDHKSFNKWADYCEKNNLKTEDKNQFKGDNLIEILNNLAHVGRAMLLFESNKIQAIINLPSSKQGKEITSETNRSIVEYRYDG